MRRFAIVLGAFFLLSLAHALEINAIDVDVPFPAVTGDFNVYWEVSNANDDWNRFVVSFGFGNVVISDLDHNWELPVGTDFNGPVIPVSACSADANDANILHCSREVNILDGNFLATGHSTSRSSAGRMTEMPSLPPS